MALLFVFITSMTLYIPSESSFERILSQLLHCLLAQLEVTFSKVFLQQEQECFEDYYETKNIRRNYVCRVAFESLTKCHDIFFAFDPWDRFSPLAIFLGRVIQFDSKVSLLMNQSSFFEGYQSNPVEIAFD